MDVDATASLPDGRDGRAGGRAGGRLTVTDDGTADDGGRRATGGGHLAGPPVAARSAILVLDWATPASRLRVRSSVSSSAGSAALARTR